MLGFWKLIGMLSTHPNLTHKIEKFPSEHTIAYKLFSFIHLGQRTVK